MVTAIGSYATPVLVKPRLGDAYLTSAGEDTLLQSICDEVNALIEGPFGTGRVLAPVASAAYLFDGDGGRRVYVRDGVRAVSLLEIAWVTGGAWNTVPAADYVLRPPAQSRHPAMPASWIELVDIPTGSFIFFPRGYANVRATMTTGPVASPDDVIDVALSTAVSAWHARQIGMTQVTGADENGTPFVTRLLTPRDRETLRAYRAAHVFGV